jgi:deferrochelatase/peroxidase EfeB
LPKALEYFYFFQINGLEPFRRAVKSFVVPAVTTAEKIISLGPTLPPSGLPKPGTNFVGFNVGLSATGLIALGLTESLHDEAFHKGQRRDAKELGDHCSAGGFPIWDTEFQQDIHGVFQITAHDEDKAQAFLSELESAFRSGRGQSSIKKVLLFRSSFRPPPETPNEHFGYRDGISKPEVEGVTFDDKRPMRFPGSPVVDLGVIVMGHEGDEDMARRPQWAIDGSFFVFRKLKSYVPEFVDFLAAEAPKVFPNLPLEKATARLGSRMFGRWKSGALDFVHKLVWMWLIIFITGTPIVLAPDEDDPAIARDNKRLNNFDYNTRDQGTCPFSAHTRKSFPRSDVNNSKKHL